MTMPMQSNPMYIASQAQQMARHADGRDAIMFQKVALISMGVVAVATATQLFRDLLKDLNRKHDNDHGHEYRSK